MRVAILGASGYTGGELIRILLFHPKAEVCYVTSRRYAGVPVHTVHPNLRRVTDLVFREPDLSRCGECDVVFLALPHGASMDIVPQLLDMGVKAIDLSADYRLKDPNQYRAHYGLDHKHPWLAEEAVYGLPELHREEIRGARLVACPGCMATSVILALAPIVKGLDVAPIVSDVKMGSSGAGSKPSLSSHHPERAGVVRAYKLIGHRHTAEIEQELSRVAGRGVRVFMSAHAVDMVRGTLSTNYVFPRDDVEEKDVWRMFRFFYQGEPFIRVYRARRGVYRLADPKIVVGSNFCDISFELAPDRLIILSAIDNLVKGAAGQAVQDWNIMLGIDERTGLEFPGLHPI
ncbi:TPA: N-acetyl-gamma-glutamyl-phosphate reductase [Candidatus Bathyarchaeota archaeon]|nr:N-acetyl-gamma-glutamyl-phosphate reductase [Candidatus Bathyarchaeota archaeon]